MAQLQDMIDRFAPKVALAPSGCLEWIGSQNARGYGKIYSHTEGGRKITVSSHRWSYEWHYGPIPEGLTIDHLCRNTLCLLPEHLEAVTLAENIRRVPFRNKRPQCHRDFCLRGHALAGQNLYIQPRTGKRSCKECRRQASQRFRDAA